MQKTQNQITLSLPGNFNIFQHMGELKSQGFMLLSYLLEHRKKSKLKPKDMAKKLKIHVSTLRRWLKRLIELKFVTADKREIKEKVCHSELDSESKEIPYQVRDDGGVVENSVTENARAKSPLSPSDLRSADPLPHGERVIKIDPLENMLDTLDIYEAAMLRNGMFHKGVKVDTKDKLALKKIMLSHPEYMEVLGQVYELRLKLEKDRREKRERIEAQEKSDAEWKAKNGNARRYMQMG